MKYFLLLLCCFGSISLVAQTKYTLSGTVAEAESGETLIGVNVIIPSMQAGAITNEYGFYSITLPEGSYEVFYRTLGFTTKSFTIELNKNTVKSVVLETDTETLDEVILKSDIEKLNIRKPQMSVNSLSMNTIKKIPVVLGETDVIKSITLLPGVTNAGEGASGFNVRGGAAV